MNLPSNLKLFFGMLIDAKVVSQRKYYLILMSAIMVVTQFILGANILNTGEKAL